MDAAQRNPGVREQDPDYVSLYPGYDAEPQPHIANVIPTATLPAHFGFSIIAARFQK